MKIQASFEFLLLLAAVAGFSVFVVAGYARFSGEAHQVFTVLSAQGDAVAPAPEQYAAQGASLYAYLPGELQVGRESQLSIAVSCGSATLVSYIAVEASGGLVVTPPSQSNVPCAGAYLLQLPVLPQSYGNVSVTVAAAVVYGNSTSVYTYTVRSVAAAGPGANETGSGSGVGNQQLSARISNRNETLQYAPGAPQTIGNFTYTTHCAWYAQFGGLEPEQEQCGPGSWGIITGDFNCNTFWYNGQDRYYCFYLSNTSYSASGISQDPTLSYSAALSLYNSTTIYSSTISSASPNSVLYGAGNSTAGEVHVMYASQQGMPSAVQGYMVASNGQSSYLLPAGAYQNYSSHVSSLVGELGIYNGTRIGKDTLDYILGEIQYTNSAATMLAQSQPANVPGCSVVGHGAKVSVNCVPPSPFAYQLYVSVPGLASNQSIGYEGSLIQVG